MVFLLMQNIFFEKSQQFFMLSQNMRSIGQKLLSVARFEIKNAVCPVIEITGLVYFSQYLAISR